MSNATQKCKIMMDWSFPYSELSSQFVNCKADFPSVMQRNGPVFLSFRLHILAAEDFFTLRWVCRQGINLTLLSPGMIRLCKNVVVFWGSTFWISTRTTHDNKWQNLKKVRPYGGVGVKHIWYKDEFIHFTLHLKSSYICVTAWNCYNQPSRKYHEISFSWCKLTARS